MMLYFYSYDLSTNINFNVLKKVKKKKFVLVFKENKIYLKNLRNLVVKSTKPNTRFH